MPPPSVVSDPKIMMGKPVIAGTRITVELLLEKLAAGEPAEQIHRAYPHLPEGSISAALGYAAAVVRNELIVPLDAPLGMRLLADESVDGPVVVRLRADGHEVAWVAEDAPGAADDAVLARAYGEGVVLVTADKDFGELVYRQRRPHAGVLLLRLAGLDEAAKCELVSRAVVERGVDLAGAFSVLDGSALRIRRDPSA